MFEQAELQDTQMGPNGPPNAKARAELETPRQTKTVDGARF